MIGDLRRGERALGLLGSVEVGGALLPSPFMTASGTSGHDVELSGYMPLERLGAVVAKSLFHQPWPGNPPPRVHLASAGMINAVGLQGPGVRKWCEESLPLLRGIGARVVVSIWGRTVDEYVQAARQVSPVEHQLLAVEVNLSCPNLEGRSGIIAHDADMSGRVIESVRSELTAPLWAKLSANTDRVVGVARAVSSAGAGAVVLSNTMLGLQIDPSSGRPTLGNGGGGLSGPAIRPIALRCVHDVHAEMPNLDIVGVGGIVNGLDAIAMMMAGARAVQVGTASFARPGATWRVARQAALHARRLGRTSWGEVTGSAHLR